MKRVIPGDKLVESGLFQTQQFLDAEFSGFRTQLLHELYIKDNGAGRIRLIKDYKGHPWASARLTGKDRMHYRQGIFRARLKLPWENGAHGSMWEDSSQIPAYNELSGHRQARDWAFYPERDIFESNKDGKKGGMSNGILCTPVIGKPAHDLSMEFTMQQFGADPDAFNDWAMESDGERWHCYLNGIEYRTIWRARLNPHRQDTWDSWKFALLALVPSRWAGNPNNGNYSKGVDMVIDQVEFDIPPTLVAFPQGSVSQPEENEPQPEEPPTDEPQTPTPQQEESMDITFKAAADEAGRPNEWHLFWTLDGAPSNNVTLVIVPEGAAPLRFSTTGLAHVWVPKSWKYFQYWLRLPDGTTTQSKEASLPGQDQPEPPPTSIPADIKAVIAMNKALATSLLEDAADREQDAALLKHRAEQLTLGVGILEGVLGRVA